jgi:uncharacterized membrane protein
MKSNAEIRAEARKQLKGNWLEAVGIYLISGILITVASILPVAGSLLVAGPLTLGLMGYFSRRARGEAAQLENLFDGFKRFGSSFILIVLQTVFITLWSCLLFIPGIVKCFSYSMSYFILRDHPDMGANDAITESRKMMNGHKGELFGLYLSFIGWGILCVFTFGIGYLWLSPYMMQSLANFYEELKKNQGDVAPEPIVLN